MPREHCKVCCPNGQPDTALMDAVDGDYFYCSECGGEFTKVTGVWLPL